jgi:hypothetical protein
VTTRRLGPSPLPLPAALTSLVLEVPALDMVVQWRRCGVVADYVAEYLALSFEQPSYAQSVLSTVTNELVENAVRFSADKARPIRVEAHHRGEVVELLVSNLAAESHILGLEALFADLARGDLTSVFRERVEARTRGGLGLLILAKDYGAVLGAMLAPEQEARTQITMQVVLPTKELSNP